MKMKFTKKIATILLSVCLIVPCFSVMALAANGVIFFSDLETSVGDEFTITGTAVVSGDVIGDATIHMTYDPSYMRFEEGDGVNADTDGNLTFRGSGDGSSDRIEFTMKFQALQEGSTRLEQGDAMVTDSAGSSVACEEGYADVTIGAGDPSKIKDVASGTSVTIDGQEYTLSGDFSDSMIPAGFTAGEITYNDSTYKGAVQEKTGLQMAYLVDGDGKGDFWMYDSSDSSFSPAEQVVISDTYSIVIFDAGSKVSMPSKYSKGNLEINGKTFEIWDEPDRDGFYVLYAVNNDGEESLYLYDSVEHTYQRMETPKSATTPDKKSASKFDAILEKISDHLIWFVAAAAVIVILLVIFLLVSVVKLHNRNRELDDLYDEYGIDLDEEEEALKAKKKEEKQEKKGRESMRNRKVKIFALVMAGCLCLSGLTGCGGGIKMTTDDTSSKSDSGLMGSAKKEAEKSDESEADSADEEDKISDDMIGRYVSQGYENPSFGFAINLPDTYTLENRNNVALNDADIVESSNSEGTYDYLKSLISLGSAVVFSAEDGNTYIELNIQNAAVLDKTATWDEEKNIAENSVMTEEDAKKLMGEDAQVTEFQNNVEEITFLGEKHYAAQYTFKNYDVSYYGVTVFLVNEQDSQYMLAVNIIGVDLNVVDQADQFFSVYTE